MEILSNVLRKDRYNSIFVLIAFSSSVFAQEFVYIIQFTKLYVEKCSINGKREQAHAIKKQRFAIFDLNIWVGNIDNVREIKRRPTRTAIGTRYECNNRC